MIADYHVHPERDERVGMPFYTEERIEEYVARARKLGIEEVGITEHASRFPEFAPVADRICESPRCHPLVREWLQSRTDVTLEEYLSMLLSLKERGLPVKAGLELDYVPGSEEELAPLVDHPWDYVLCGVHLIDGWAFDFSPRIGWDEADVDTVYEHYIEIARRAAASGLFHVMAHLDLVKKFGHRPTRDFTEEWRSLVEEIAERGLAVELNTAGLRKPVAEIYPSSELLRMCRSLDIPVTMGSDAHSPEDVGLGFEEGVATLRECGYRRIALFDSGNIGLECMGE